MESNAVAEENEMLKKRVAELERIALGRKQDSTSKRLFMTPADGGNTSLQDDEGMSSSMLQTLVRPSARRQSTTPFSRLLFALVIVKCSMYHLCRRESMT